PWQQQQRDHRRCLGRNQARELINSAGGWPRACASSRPWICPVVVSLVRPAPVPGGDLMSRVQLSINVSDFDAAVAFYSRLFGTAPAKLRPGYANLAVDDPRRLSWC